MKRIFSISFICFSAFATDVSPTLDEAVKNYAQLHQMTLAPHFINEVFTTMCRQVPLRIIDPDQVHEKELIYDERKARDRFGPHTEHWIHVYMNDLAQKAFLATNKDYPVGSVIIKEKNSDSKKPEELGGMIKRKHSEKPSVDDWEFFYKEAGKKPSSARMESCKDCHANAASKDFVFGNWLELSLKKVKKAVIPLHDPPINPLLND